MFTQMKSAMLHPSLFPDEQSWREEVSWTLEQLVFDSAGIINGQIEFPAPGAEEHNGNIKCSFVELTLPLAGAGDYLTPICVPHGYGDGAQGQKPRGWIQMANSLGSASMRLCDQVLSSSFNTAYNVVGDATVTVTNATTITGGGTWLTTGIQAGDEIKCFNSVAVAMGVTGAVTAGSRSVTLSGPPAVTPLPGWWVRFAVGADVGMREVIAYEPATRVMTIGTPYLATAAAAAATQYYTDNAWAEIASLTATVLTLTSPGSTVPAGTANCGYVIRRPPDNDNMWIRAISVTAPFETTLMVF